MSAADLRNAFNSGAGDAATCNMALLNYERADGREWQVLTFRGSKASGEAFEVMSGRQPPDSDILAEAARLGAAQRG